MKVENGTKGTLSSEEEDKLGEYRGREISNGASSDKGAKTAMVAGACLQDIEGSREAARQERQGLRYLESPHADRWSSPAERIDPRAGEKPGPDFLLPLGEVVLAGAAASLGGKAAAYLHQRRHETQMLKLQGQKETLGHQKREVEFNRDAQRGHLAEMRTEIKDHPDRKDLGEIEKLHQEDVRRADKKLDAATKREAAMGRKIERVARKFEKAAPSVINKGRVVGGIAAAALLVDVAVTVGSEAYESCTKLGGTCNKAFKDFAATPLFAAAFAENNSALMDERQKTFGLIKNVADLAVTCAVNKADLKLMVERDLSNLQDSIYDYHHQFDIDVVAMTSQLERFFTHVFWEDTPCPAIRKEAPKQEKEMPHPVTTTMLGALTGNTLGSSIASFSAEAAEVAQGQEAAAAQQLKAAKADASLVKQAEKAFAAASSKLAAANASLRNTRIATRVAGPVVGAAAAVIATVVSGLPEREPPLPKLRGCLQNEDCIRTQRFFDRGTAPTELDELIDRVSKNVRAEELTRSLADWLEKQQVRVK